MISQSTKVVFAIVAATLVLIVLATSCRRLYSNSSPFHSNIDGTHHQPVETSRTSSRQSDSLGSADSSTISSSHTQTVNCKGPRDTVSGSANTLVIYTGRWKFLRILFPYVYRELRKNGGVLDRVVYMMVAYDDETLQRLTELVKKANEHLKENVFEMNFQGYEHGKRPPDATKFVVPYYQMFSEIIDNSSKRFFKLDDDIIYIHLGTFRKIIESKDSDRCFLHFANTVSNWRCNYKHQEMGVYESKEVNPKKLKFEFNTHAKCGWKSLECAELTLRTFLHYYHRQQLEKYLFDDLELLVKRNRFSINLFMLDRDLIDIEVMQEVGPIGADDEDWWTVKYAGKFKAPNCIVGNGLVVHFSYYPTSKEILQTGILKEFETIVQKEVGELLDKKLWKALKFSSPINV